MYRSGRVVLSTVRASNLESREASFACSPLRQLVAAEIAAIAVTGALTGLPVARSDSIWAKTQFKHHELS